MLSFRQLNEAAYQNNIGFEEMVKFYKNATRAQSAQMDKIIIAEDWEAFKKLIKTVTGVSLK